MDINDKLLARLIAGHKKPKALTGENGLLQQLTKPQVEGTRPR